ncbi:MAG: hisC2 [Myxococcaceae bacterium]|nr:hisC2 [Myxococcaceae bacterium]
MTPTAWFAPLLRPELAALAAYVPAPIPPGAIRLDANESPWALSDDARASLAEALARVPLHRYPDVRATALREAIAADERVHPDAVVLGCGSDEVIGLLANTLAAPRPGAAHAAVFFPTPTFVMYRQTALSLGLRPHSVPLDAAFDLDLDATLAALREHRPNLVFLASPNNPTGTLFSADRLAAVLWAAPDALVVLDEAYAAFSGVRYAALAAQHPNAGRLQTLSKVGLAALRVGWAILPPALAAAVEKVRQPYNLNALSQAAAVHCLTALRPEIDAAVRRIVAERERLAPLLAAVPGLDVTPSAANFFWIAVPDDAARVAAAMRERGVVVRSFHAHGGSLTRRMRVTVGTPEENDRMLEALRASL